MSHTLLLADDSVTIQRVIELTFAEEDVQVVAVGDGDEAIAQIDRRPPDIVLADVGMPGKNGYEVAAHVKRSPRLAHIPVVLLTGAFEPVDQAMAGAVGCDGVLAKPFEPQLVISRVKELLARPRPPSSTPHPDVQASAAPAAGDLAAPVPESAAAATPARLDEYFDRLDAAFSSLSAGANSESGPSTPPLGEDLDWFGLQPTRPAGETWEEITLPELAPQRDDISLPQGPQSEAAVDWAAPGGEAPAEPTRRDAAPSPPKAGVAPAPAAPRPAAPASLADAFAALLAAEQETPGPSVAPIWSPPIPAAPAITEELIEQVTRRVMDRLSDRELPAAVREIVTSVAERLVKDEIEKIKASIK